MKKIVYLILSILALTIEINASAPLVTKSAQEFLSTQSYKGLSGRVMRGKTAEHFEYLNADLNRKLVFIIGEEGLSVMKEMNGYEMLMSIGYTSEHIEYLVMQENNFKLLVFPSLQCHLATWDNILQLASEIYPEIAKDLQKHKQALKTLPFEAFEEALGYKFCDIEKSGRTHPGYMTYERYYHSSRTLVDTRAFLYFTLSLRELFSGDGYTYDFEGNRGLNEYVILNRKIFELNGAMLLDIKVNIPTLAHIES